MTNSPAKLDITCEILTTRSLILRPLEKDDAREITALANNINVASMLESMPYPYFEKDALKFIEANTCVENTGCTYAIIESRTGILVGICGLHQGHKRFGLPYIGYWLGEPHWGKGYATEAARALVDFFFKAGKQDELLFSVLNQNVASRRVIEKCGGKYWKQDMVKTAAIAEQRKLDHYRITRESWMGAIAA